MVVTILGKEYPVRELSLAQKNNLFSNVGELLRSVFKHVFVKKKQQ